MKQGGAWEGVGRKPAPEHLKKMKLDDLEQQRNQAREALVRAEIGERLVNMGVLQKTENKAR